MKRQLPTIMCLMLAVVLLVACSAETGQAEASITATTSESTLSEQKETVTSESQITEQETTEQETTEQEETESGGIEAGTSKDNAPIVPFVLKVLPILSTTNGLY